MLTREELIFQIKNVVDKSRVFKSRKAIRLHYLAALNVNPRLRSARMLKFVNKFIDSQMYWRNHFRKYSNYYRQKKLFVKSKKKSVYSNLTKHKHYILTFRSFTSNFFIMLTDHLGNPLINCSTGQVTKNRSKKKKNSMMLIYPMMKKIKAILIKRRIKYLAIHLKTDINPKIVTAIRFLNYSRIKFRVTYIALLKPTPHHFGRKPRKPRRV